VEYLPNTDRWIPFEAPAETCGAFPTLLGLDTSLHLLGGKSSGGPASGHQSYQAIYTILLPVIR